MVIDGDVEIFPSLAVTLCAVAVDTMPHTVNLRQLLDVDMDNLAGSLALIAARLGLRADVAFAADAVTLEVTADGAVSQPEVRGNAISRHQERAAQVYDRILAGLRQLPW